MRTEPARPDPHDLSGPADATAPPAPLLAGEDETEAEPHIIRGLD